MPRKLDFSHIQDISTPTNNTSDVQAIVNDLVSEKLSVQTQQQQQVNGLISHASMHALSQAIMPLSTAPITIKDMAKWHTPAEQKVYKVMVTQAQHQEHEELYFSFQDLSTRTGFRNRRTIIAAIQGLITKQSIEIISDQPGNHLGRSYRVYSPEEIMIRRKEIGIKIHPQTKKII